MGLPRVRYNGKIVDFNKKPVDLNRGNERVGYGIDALSGRREFNLLHERDAVSVNWRFEQPQIASHEFLDFWSWARSNQTFALWVDNDIGLFMGFDGSTLVTNDGQTGTVSRNGAAYRVNPYTGYIESIASGQPRFESGKYGQALLVESAGTNYCTRSSELEDGGWIKTNASVSTGITYLKDIANATGARRVDFSAAAANILFTSSQAASTNTGNVASIWLRSLDRNEAATLHVGDSVNGDVFSNGVTVTPAWQRFESSGVTFPAPGNVNIKVQAGNGVTIFAKEAQLEINRLTASSVLPTSGSTASRNAEVVDIPITLDDLNLLKGTLSYWIYPLHEFNESSVHYYISIINASSQEFIRTNINAAGLFVNRMFLADNSTSVFANPSGSFLTKNSWDNLITLTWDTTISNGLKIYHNGILKSTSSNNSFMPIQEPNKLRIGDSTNSAGAKFDDILLLKNVLTLSEISDIYDLGKSQGIGKNFYKELILNNDAWIPDFRSGNPYYEFGVSARERK